MKTTKRMMKFIPILLWVFCLGCTSKRAPEDFVVGMDLSYPPFETIDVNGQPTGVSVDIARALAQYLHRPLRIENIPFTGLIPSLQNKRIDAVISSMTDTPERRASISFSDPYLSIGLALLVGRNSAISSITDLDRPGKTIVVRQGTTAALWAGEHVSKARVISVEKENMAVLEVIQGKADAFIYDQMSVWQNARKHPDTTRAILEPIQQEFWAVGIRKDDDALRKQINAFLKAFRKKGEFEKLGDRYLKDQKEAFQKAGIPFYL